MEQRLLRLGDIVDDYCPRERRITNHAIVAIVDNVVKQTRCSTCDADHEYKEAKVPKKRVKPAGVLVGAKPAAPKDVPLNDSGEVAEASALPEANGNFDAPGGDAAETLAAEAVNQTNGDGQAQDEPGEPVRESWFSHRPLIRASLPRTENEPPPARAIPEFTMHQRHGRGFGGRGFRHGHGHSGHGHSGNGAFRNPNNQSSNGNEPDGNRAAQPPRPGRRRRRRRPR